MTVSKRVAGRVVLGGVFVLAVAATGVLIGEVAEAERRSRTLSALLDRYDASSDDDANAGDAGSSRGDSVPQDPRVGRVTSRSLFAPKPPPTVKALAAPLVGVLGSRAYFQGNPTGFAVGERFGDARIVEIGPTWAKVDIDGNVQTCSIAGGAPGGASVEGAPSGSASPEPGTAPGPPGGDAGGPPAALPAPAPAPACSGMRTDGIPPALRPLRSKPGHDAVGRNSKRH